MAKIIDSNGSMLGGYPRAQLPFPSLTTSALVSGKPMNPQYGPEETVPGLICSYGAKNTTHPSSRQEPALSDPKPMRCHASIEMPDERHHCEFCGGDFCSIHSERAAHDCDQVVLPH